MREGIFAYLILGAVALSVGAAPPDSKPATPTQVPFAPLVPKDGKASSARIQFKEMVHDFGRIQSSQPCRVDFVFTNVGTSVLEITDVKPGCGCTTASPWDKQVQPGQIGKIPIQFNPGNFNGTVTKSVTVTCNDPVQAVHNLQLKATIWRPIDIQPAYLYFMGVEGETSTNDVKIAKIVSNLEQPLKLEAPQSSNARFNAELKTIKPGKEFDLQVTQVGGASNATPQGVISIKTSDTNMPVLTVTAYSMPQPAVAVMPQAIRLPAGQLTNEFRSIVTVRNNSSTSIKLSDAVVTAEGVKAEITEAQPGKQFTINVAFPPEFKQSPGKPLELTVKTTHPRNPMLRVPIMQTPANPVLAKPAIPSTITK